jgi:hypothetical protein
VLMWLDPVLKAGGIEKEEAVGAPGKRTQT